MGEAYRAGTKAARAGERRDANPYTGGCNGWFDWNNGFDTARAKGERKKRRVRTTALRKGRLQKKSAGGDSDG